MSECGLFFMSGLFFLLGLRLGAGIMALMRRGTVEAERDALRAALKIANKTLIEALEYIDDPYNELAVYIGDTLASIDAALNEGGE